MASAEKRGVQRTNRRAFVEDDVAERRWQRHVVVEKRYPLLVCRRKKKGEEGCREVKGPACKFENRLQSLLRRPPCHYKQMSPEENWALISIAIQGRRARTRHRQEAARRRCLSFHTLRQLELGKSAHYVATTFLCF
jgi:hypothetical protein